MPASFVSRRAAIALPFAAVAAAKSPVEPINASRGVALRGYDPVAYFDAGKAVKGAMEHTHEWRGAKWRFATPENLAKFRENPERFAPQFGGYCAYAVSENYTADGDPLLWTVHNGKLYVNYNEKAQRLWLQNVDERIAAGERNWPGLHR